MKYSEFTEKVILKNMQVLADLRFGLTCSKLFNCWINNASTLESLQKDQALAKNATRFVFWNFLYILLSCLWKAQSCFAASDEDEHIVCWSISSCITHCNCSTQFYQQRAWEQRVDKSGYVIELCRGDGNPGLDQIKFVCPNIAWAADLRESFTSLNVFCRVESGHHQKHGK